MKKPLKSRTPRRTKWRRKAASSPAKAVAKAGRATRKGRMAPCVPDGTDEAPDDVLRLGSPSIDDILRTARVAQHLPEGDAEREATPVSVPPDLLDISTDYMPVGVEYVHLPPCDPPDEYRRQHLCLMVGEDGGIVGSGYGSTWVNARIEACALYRRDRIRSVSVRKPEDD